MAAILDLPEVQARIRRFTVTDYERLAEIGEVSPRAELIRGFIIEKMPKSPLHAYLTSGIRDFFRRVARHGFIVRQENPLRFVDSMPEPDVAVVRGEEKDFRTRHPTAAELVVEVAVNSAALDRENASLYTEANVPEYWIVLGTEEKVEVYREPVNGSYQSRRVYGRGEIIENVNITDGAVPVAALFAWTGMQASLPRLPLRSTEKKRRKYSRMKNLFSVGFAAYLSLPAVALAEVPFTSAIREAIRAASSASFFPLNPRQEAAFLRQHPHPTVSRKQTDKERLALWFRVLRDRQDFLATQRKSAVVLTDAQWSGLAAILQDQELYHQGLFCAVDEDVCGVDVPSADGSFTVIIGHCLLSVLKPGTQDNAFLNDQGMTRLRSWKKSVGIIPAD